MFSSNFSKEIYPFSQRNFFFLKKKKRKSVFELPLKNKNSRFIGIEFLGSDPPKDLMLVNSPYS